MKRKDDAEERNQTEKEQQKSVERTHWTISDDINSKCGPASKPNFIVEYDYSGGPSGPFCGTVRQSFKSYNKETERTFVSPSGLTVSKEPLNKIPKLIRKHH